MGGPQPLGVDPHPLGHGGTKGRRPIGIVMCLHHNGCGGPFGLPSAVGLLPRRHQSFRQRLYGGGTTSWAGKYQYHRRGVLDEVPHVRLYWGVIIVRSEDRGKLELWLRGEDAEVTTRRVVLTGRTSRTLLS